MRRPLVDANWLRRNFDDPDLVILDGSPESNKADMAVRHPGVRISGARFFDLKTRFSDQASDLPNMIPAPDAFTEGCQALGINAASKIVVYDNLDLYASPRVWWMFRVMGHANVAVLDGGLNAWIASGGATEVISERSYERGDFTAAYDAAAVKDAAQIFANIEAEAFSVIDARSAGRFNAEVPEPRPNSRSGRIPGSSNLPFGALCKDGKFLPKAALKARFDKLNLGGDPLVFSCGSGMTACIGLLAAALVLENDLALYDGSWSEWGASEWGAENTDWPVA